MSMQTQDNLRDYYHRELTYLRQQGEAFAKRYPKVASRLELGPDTCADPQVERLLEGFAFLTARIQRQFDSEFPEITSALLGVLYPQFLNPVPSMAVARFEVDPEQGKLTSGHLIDRHTSLFAQSPQGPTCRFLTCYPVTLWPVEVTYAGIEATANFDFLTGTPNVAAVLRLRLASQGVMLQELALQRLRFYIQGDSTVASALYELLFCHVQRVAIVPENGTHPVYLPDETIVPVGFAAEEAVLPYPRHAHAGYRLLQEYFTFPEKFLFFDLQHLDAHASHTAFDVLFLLNRMPPKGLAIDRRTFCLGCTPMINLFRKTTEPIRLDHRKTDYRLIPDLRRERWAEIHSIRRVSASSTVDEVTKALESFFSFNHHLAARDHKAFWHARRVPSSRPDFPGTDMLLSFVDLDFTPTQPATQTVYAHTLCTNRDLAEHLPAGAILQIEEAAPLARISCLSKPTPQLAPPLGGATLWRLISHLSLNHLSLSAGQESLPALREILTLYSAAERLWNYTHIMGIQEMSCRSVVRRVGLDAWRGFCRGVEITLTFDEDHYVGSGAVVFASVLHHFFALYTSGNSFTQLVMKRQDREGIVKQWPPMAGAQIVL